MTVKTSVLLGAKERDAGLMRFLGLREIAAGIVVLSGARAAGCWSRVAGDLMDLSLLGGQGRHMPAIMHGGSFVKNEIN